MTRASWELRKGWAFGVGIRLARAAKVGIGGFDWIRLDMCVGNSDAADVA